MIQKFNTYGALLIALLCCVIIGQYSIIEQHTEISVWNWLYVSFGLVISTAIAIFGIKNSK